ncbi:MAG: hypothetical protein KF863_21425 [Rubrivivax sp.]|nr:hypothetical protein [Rubrivivax sp.]
MDAQLEERVANHRARTRQNKEIPFLIRDDGMLMPNVPLIAKNPRFRPYHGDVSASLEERMQYLRGETARRRVINSAVQSDPAAPFDIAKASKDDLIAFAQEEYGYTVDPALHLNKIRSDVARLAGIDPKTIFSHGAKTADGEH